MPSSQQVAQPWQLTASEALPLLRSGELTAEAYCRSLLDRIQRRDAEVKAWVYLSPQLILKQARALDELPADERGPLHGLPVGVKDIILTKDMPTQYNSRIYESEEPIGIDANAVLTLRSLGALMLGKTATTEFATTKQGGSSSGSGAAVGDLQVPIAFGTQTGGSIIRPASYNGCYGYKPTWCAISREGLGQWCVTLDTCGFFTRSVEDLELLADTYRIQDDQTVPAEPFHPRGSRIGFCKTYNWPKAGPGTQKAMEKAKEILQKHGASVEYVELPDDFAKVLDWHADVLSAEGRSSFLGQYLADKTKLHEDIQGHVENKRNVSHRSQLEAYDNCARLRPLWDSIAEKYDVVITPSVTDEAPSGLENTGDMSFNSMWTILQVPALNIPGFQGENGMPIGLTAVGARFTDRHLLYIAKTIGPLFEKEGGWQRKNL